MTINNNINSGKCVRIAPEIPWVHYDLNFQVLYFSIADQDKYLNPLAGFAYT